MAQQGNGTKITTIKGGKIRSPKGIARYAYVNRPDDSAFGKNRYRITVVFDKSDPEYVTFAKKLVALAKMHAAEIGVTGKPAVPIKFVDEKFSKGKDGKGGTGDEIGQPYMEFESNSKFVRKGKTIEVTIPTFNAKSQEEDLQIYGGDDVRVEARISGWFLKGNHGVKGYLNAVQQLRSNWSGGTGSSFAVEDEYLTDEDEADAEEVTDEVGSSFSDDNDDLADDDGALQDADTDEVEDPLAGLV